MDVLAFAGARPAGSWRTVCSLTVALWAAPSLLLAATVLASTDDAVVSRDDAANTWTIGSASIAVTYGFAANRALVVQQMVNPQTGRRWPITAGPDFSLTLRGVAIKLSEGSTGLTFDSVSADTANGGVRLMFRYVQNDLRIAIRRVYACYPGAPVIEAWTKVELSPGGANSVSVAGLTAWDLAMPVATVRWVSGIQGDTPDVPNDNAFTRVQRDLAPDQEVHIGSDRRSSEQSVPFAMIDGASDEFFGGSIWSGSWQIAFVRHDPLLHVTLSYPQVTTTVSEGRPLETPHGFFGTTPGTSDRVAAALRPFIDKGIRQGRPLTPLITYNTWFAHGTDIDEASMMREINDTADLGVELFVLDAGWYVGAGASSAFDFESGLGSWQVDPDRFPHGLHALRDLARSRGMKFGLWVEPERVSLDTVGRPALAQESWLAMRDGSYGSTTTAQVCLGHAAGLTWVRQQLFALLDSVQPDYLKWDNNFWINCNRPGHDHGAEDGNLAHVQGLYALLQAVRDNYPDLMIENSASGGNRIDYGWLRFSEVAWMDDRTAPSSVVRHNFQGLAAAFPPSYLLSFIIDSGDESIFDGADIPLYLRSRMPGILGMTYVSSSLPDATFTSLSDVVQAYASIRDTVANGDAQLLTPQATASADTPWEAIQEVDPVTGNAVLFVYQSEQAPSHFTVVPRALTPDASYEVSSLDAGVIATASGAALMRDGIEVVQGAEASRAHVLILTVKR